MSSQIVKLAVGTEGLNLSIPTGIDFHPIPTAHSLDATPAIGVARQQEILRSALVAADRSPSLLEFAKGRRRVVILAGGMALPAPYEILLPVMSQVLEEAGIRPTRISLLACPHGSGPLLGRAAIRRYGDDFVGDHECQIWKNGPEDGADPLYASADLRISLSPWIPPFGPHNLIPNGLPVDFQIQLKIGSKPSLEIESARCASQNPPKSETVSDIITSTEVSILAGGGGEWEATLEEAILSLHLHNVKASAHDTVVLAFSGIEGLGSAQFTLDFWSLLNQADEMLSQGQGLTEPEAGDEMSYDPILAFASALAKYKRIVLYSPALAEHEEGDDLIDRLGKLTKLSERMLFAASELELWGILNRKHGAGYSLAIHPIGWRAHQYNPV